MKFSLHNLCFMIIALSTFVHSNNSQTMKRTPAIQPGTAYQNQAPMNRNLMGMQGMGGMNPMQQMQGGMPGMGGMNPMQQMQGGMPGMGGMNPMQQMGGMNPMQGGMPGMGGMNPMQQNWGWGQNPATNMRKSSVAHQTR